MTDRASRFSSAFFIGVSAALAICPADSHAQSFGFSVGSGGHCHHHHCGGWSFGFSHGPYWGPAYYAPPAIVYAPPPVIQDRVIYVQPPPAPAPAVLPANPYTSTSSAPSSSLAANNAPSLAGSTSSDDRIVIRNAAGAKLPVSFLVDGQDVDLNDGATRTFVGRTRRTIQYDRGGHFGSTQQDLTGGQYEFRITASGWDLVRKPDLLPSSRTAV